LEGETEDVDLHLSKLYLQGLVQASRDCDGCLTRGNPRREAEVNLLQALEVIDNQPEKVKDGALNWATDYVENVVLKLVAYVDGKLFLTENAANDIHWLLLRARANMQHWRGETAKEVKRTIDRVLEECKGDNYVKALKKEIERCQEQT
jgi:hypothetical protein